MSIGFRRIDRKNSILVNLYSLKNSQHNKRCESTKNLLIILRTSRQLQKILSFLQKFFIILQASKIKPGSIFSPNSQIIIKKAPISQFLIIRKISNTQGEFIHFFEREREYKIIFCKSIEYSSQTNQGLPDFSPRTKIFPSIVLAMD